LGFLKRLLGGASEAGPQNAPPNTVLGGEASLEVVGESFHQESLRKLVGSTTERVRIAVEAILDPETNNPYDPNAVAVSISGMQVGHLSREDAIEFHARLIELQEQTHTAIALPGVIAGGGEGRPSLGVFLNYDPHAFGLPAQAFAIRTRGTGIVPQVRTGFSQAVADDDKDDDYDLGWQSRVPTDRLKAMAFLRHELPAETEPVSRHFMYAQLEELLYGARDDLGSALGDYDATCEAHHAEMATIRPALIKTFHGLPLLETYAQASIRHQKSHDWQSALRWATAGISVYEGDALRPEFVDDLLKRQASYRMKLAPTPSRPRPERGAQSPGEPVIETLACSSCGKSFERARIRGRKPQHCPECRLVAGETEL
jgi:hypothetical protein